MSERSQEQKAKDLRDGLRMVENKDIDGIPWYCAEAMADEISRLREELADIKESWRFVMEEPCPSDEKHCTCVPVLKAELAKISTLMCGNPTFKGDLAQYVKNQIDGRAAAEAEVETLTAELAEAKKNNAIDNTCGDAAFDMMKARALEAEAERDYAHGQAEATLEIVAERNREISALKAERDTLAKEVERVGQLLHKTISRAEDAEREGERLKAENADLKDGCEVRRNIVLDSGRAGKATAFWKPRALAAESEVSALQKKLDEAKSGSHMAQDGGWCDRKYWKERAAARALEVSILTTANSRMAENIKAMADFFKSGRPLSAQVLAFCLAYPQTPTDDDIRWARERIPPRDAALQPPSEGVRDCMKVLSEASISELTDQPPNETCQICGKSHWGTTCSGPSEGASRRNK